MNKYLVGGAVRDKMMGLTPKDHDWLLVGCTAADIEAMLAEGFEQVGKDFPVFLHPTTREEYALARTERKTGVGYHGFEAYFDADVTVEEDLARRDLTINSIAYDEERGLYIDPFDGIYDVHHKILRHTTEAFAEDPLRVVRLARFAARYASAGFTVAPETMELCRKVVASGEMDALPDERYMAELTKVIDDDGDVCVFFDVLKEVGALTRVQFFIKARMYMAAQMLDKGPECLDLSRVPKDDRLNVLLLVCGAAEGLDIVPGVVKQADASMLRFGALLLLDTNVERVVDALTKLRAWPTVSDQLRLLFLSFTAQGADVVRMTKLSAIIDAGRSVSGSDFPYAVGPQVGRLIKDRRTELAAKIL
jgi:tRNA nucleotidyltransferase/poly(A) polymerase